MDSPDFVLSVIAISLNDLFDKKCSAAEEKVAYKENGNNLGISITLSITCFAAFTTHLIGTETVAWLGEESLKRYMKLKPSTHVPNKAEKVARVRKTRGGAILDPCDHVGDVLDDNDFVSVGKAVC